MLSMIIIIILPLNFTRALKINLFGICIYLLVPFPCICQYLPLVKRNDFLFSETNLTNVCVCVCHTLWYHNFNTNAVFVYCDLCQYRLSLLTIHITQTQPKQSSILVKHIDWQSNKWLIELHSLKCHTEIWRPNTCHWWMFILSWARKVE